MADQKSAGNDGRVVGRAGKQDRKPGFKRANPLVDETPLEEVRERFRAVMNSTINGIVLADDKRNVISWNTGAQNIFGYTEKEILGRQLSLIFADRDEDSGLRRLEPSSSGKYRIIDKRTLELEGRKKNRIKFPMEITISTWETGKRTFHIAVIRDITQRKEAEEKLRQNMEQLKQAKEELKQNAEQLERTIGGTIAALAFMVGTRDPYTAGHQRRVARLACAIAKETGFSGDTIVGIGMAGEIHDLGKMSIPAEILSKPGELTEADWSMIKSHPQNGYDALKNIDFPWPIAQIILQHHERLDGSGYPDGIPGEHILPEARIISIADVVEAMASFRPYRPARGIEAALDEIEKNSGILYDPDMAKACLRLFNERNFTLEYWN